MARRTSQPAGERYNDAQIKVVSEHTAWGDFMAFIKSDKFRFIVGLLLAFITVYLFIAYLSFFSTGADDFSILERSSSERKILRENIDNITGLPGAIATYLLVNKFCGLAVLFLYILSFIFSLRWMGIIRIHKWRVLFTYLFILLWGSLALAFVQNVFNLSLFFRLGGNLGDMVIQYAISYIHVIGTVFVLFATLFVFLICIDERTIVFFYRAGLWLKKCIQQGFVALKEKRMQRQQEQEKEKETKETAPVEPENEMEEPTLPIENTEIDVVNSIDLEIQGSAEPETIVQPNETPTPTLEIVSSSQEEVENEVIESESVIEKEENIAPIDENPPLEEETEEQKLTINQPQDVEIVDENLEKNLANLGPYDPRKDLEFYQFPSLDLLKVYDNETMPIINKEEQQANANRIVETLRNYGVEIDSIKATIGPTVTLYEVIPKAGVKIAKIQGLENDIMLSLSAMGIRIIAPMPGKGTVGIEVPNEKPQIVSMHSVLASKRFQEEQKMRLPVAIGRTITNEVFMFDLAKTPHLLVAGATGQGKSVGLNAIITSLLYKKHPSELKFVLVDPKMVEFSIYKPLIKHYMAAMPNQEDNEIIITDCQKVINTLNSLVIEMENRYTLLMDASVRNLEEYNQKFIERKLNPTKEVINQVTNEVLYHHFMPYLVIIIDEYGDFIMQAGKEVERPIQRIAQKARAVGMHMILATQRPDVKIVTGTIKANIPSRIAFRTQSVIDSRTVLDTKGADQLIGKGDMLYSGGGNMERIQCAFVDTPEVENIVQFIHNQQGYTTPFPLPIYEGAKEEGKNDTSDIKKLDSLFAEVARYVVSNQEGSTSKLQRTFDIGYNRAGRLTDQLERTGIVGPNRGAKGRDVLIQDMNTVEAILQDLQEKNLL